MARLEDISRACGSTCRVDESEVSAYILELFLSRGMAAGRFSFLRCNYPLSRVTAVRQGRLRGVARLKPDYFIRTFFLRYRQRKHRSAFIRARFASGTSGYRDVVESPKRVHLFANRERLENRIVSSWHLARISSPVNRYRFDILLKFNVLLQDDVAIE